MSKKGSLVKTIFIGMTTTAVVSILLLGTVFVHHAYEHFNEESESFRDNYIANQKALIKNEVEKVADYIEYMRSKQEEGLKDNLKSKTDQAWDIAFNIYNENKDSRGTEEIEKMIKDALRPIRFNSGRGYYFATGLDGVEQLFVDRPEMEGKDLLDLRDTNGKYVIRDMIGIAKTQKEGAYEYTWTKPGQKENNFPKLAYIKLFEPLNWLIGTGEYLDDSEESTQDLILNRIAEIRFEDEGYIFVVTYDGVTLMNDTQRDLIGRDIWEMTDPDGVKVIQEERKAVENPDGGFIEYKWIKPGGTEPFSKITFMKGIPDWGWMIGAGVYLDEIDSIIAADRKSLEQRIIRQVISVSLLLLFLLAATYITSRYIAGRIDKSIVAFSSFFQRAAAESMEIDLKEINFSEFEGLAVAANTMIDHRERIERSLRENEEKYRTLFNMESDALVLIEAATGKILDVNKAFLSLFGYEMGDVPGLREDDLSSGLDRPEEMPGNDIAYLPVIYQRKKNGTLFPAEINRREFEYQGRLLRLLMVRDVSDRERLEDQLRQAQKMEAIGTLAGGIAHDFNNILLPILGHTEMLMMGFPTDSHIQYNLRQIYDAGNRAKDMIRQILAFSRKDYQEKTPLQLGEVIGDALKLLRGSIPTTIDIQYVKKTDNDTVLANPTQIHQIILNLCANSAYDMRENGGQIRIELDDFVHDGGSADRFGRLSHGSYLRLTVADTGRGIAPGIISNIFEPYFTTKGVGEGTGMGLAVVHGIVMDHRGDIAVRSEQGKGTAFTVLLPRYNHSPGGAGDLTPMKTAAVKNGNETILLVDDDGIVADVLHEMLKRLGYEVEVKTSSVEALESFRRDPEGFDLVITDMTMPNMTGKDLAVELLAIRPEVPIILSTGFSERIDEEGARAVGIKAFVMKPVVMGELARTVRSVLDNRD